MAVVTLYGKGFKDPNSILLPPPVFAEGRMRAIVSGTIPVANGDSINSRHYLGRIPSSAILLPDSTLYHGAITGLTDYDIGLEKDGVTVDIDVLADGLSLAAAGTKSVTAALVVGTGIGKRVWEVLGLTTDPGVTYDIVGTMKAAATAAANLEAFIHYVMK